MELLELIKLLVSVDTGYRRLDGEIAKSLGWREISERGTDYDGDGRRRNVWLRPGSDEPGRVPYFTTSIDAALKLADSMCAEGVGGCGWEDGRASARLGEGPFLQASTPSLALCAVALHRRAVFLRVSALTQMKAATTDEHAENSKAT